MVISKFFSGKIQISQQSLTQKERQLYTLSQQDLQQQKANIMLSLLQDPLLNVVVQKLFIENF